MSINRWSARRDENEPQIVRDLERVGAKVRRMGRPCDLLVKFGGRVYLLEVSNPDAVGAKYRKRDKAQLEFLDQWQVPIVHTSDEALRCIGAM